MSEHPKCRQQRTPSAKHLSWLTTAARSFHAASKYWQRLSPGLKGLHGKKLRFSFTNLLSGWKERISGRITALRSHRASWSMRFQRNTWVLKLSSGFNLERAGIRVQPQTTDVGSPLCLFGWTLIGFRDGTSDCTQLHWDSPDDSAFEHSLFIS